MHKTVCFYLTEALILLYFPIQLSSNLNNCNVK